MQLKILILTLKSDRKITASGAQVRGFFATKFNEYALLHQHKASGFIYKYPLVQYKIIEGRPTIVGINEGTDLLAEIYNKYNSKITIKDVVYEIVEQNISIKQEEFGLSDKIHIYEYITPWFGLSQKNYSLFKNMRKEEKQDLLNRTAAANILSMSKGLEYVVEDTIKACVDVKIRKSSLKRTQIMAFVGKLHVNFIIPDYIGIGKSVSRGFGTLKQIKEQYG
ncbi:MAG: hypothetical protein DRN66_01565 [Candidatus Nanohalarchaeota archaeon]|nr:MAG: hypothetical protein DRN66_01565 [Candidatus Nanohaloarchaeota archaeon]